LNDKLLFSLMLAISDTLFKHGKHNTQNNMPNMFCHILKADGYAVYLQDNGSYLLHTHQSPSSSVKFAHSWQQYKWELSTSAVYINAKEKTNGFSQEGNWQSCLLLPLLGEDKTDGVVMVVWTENSPLEYIPQEEIRLLQPISQLISQVYSSSSILVAKLQQREKYLLALYQKAEQELESSRKKVSIELHDEVGQVLTSILLQIKMLQQSEDIEYVQGRLGGLHHITLQTLEEVRRISRNLRSGLLEKLGLQAAVEAHIKGYMDSTGIKVEFRHHNLKERLADNIEIIVYRAVQEGLTNIARHAQASKVLVSLSKKGDNLFLQIVDNGIGKKEEKTNGLGLLGIEERVKMAKGKFWLLNWQGQGLALNILLPLEQEG